MNVSPFDIAYSSLLKAPIVDTDIPGVRMAYENEKSEPVIGNQPYMWGSDDKVENMTPNDYFDMLAIDEEKNGINNVEVDAVEIPNKDAAYRWDGRQFTQHGGSRDNIARIMHGIKQGMPIGMPELSFRNGEYDGVQEGGHRMEALRQMGHADTPVPVWRHNRTVRTGEPMDIAMRLLKEEVDVSGQHAPRNDPKFWEVMRHYGTQDPNAVDVPFYPYNKELGEMTPQVDELIAGYGYTPYYFGGRYPMPDLGKKNYDTGHLAVFDPGEEAASFGGNEQFTANWRKLHELGHAQGLEDLNAEWGEGRRLGKLGARSPREMLRAVDWETRALTNQRKLMEEVGLPVGQTEYNRDWNTTIGDAGFRAVTGQFTSPEGEGFVPHDEKISQDHAMNAVRTRAEELGLDMDETSADKRRRDKTGGARKVASEPMDIAYQLLKWEEHSDMHGPEKNFNQYFGIKDSWVTLPKEGMDSRPELYGEVASAMNTAYAGVGGHDKYKNGDDLQDEDKHARYDMIDNDQDPYVDAARVFSQQDQGFKVSLTAHDGRKDARVAVKEHMFDHMKTPGHYAELSGGWNRLMEEQDIAPIEDYEHIQDLVNRPTRPTETGPGTYTRDIGGTEREKQIYGQPMKEGAEWTNDFMQQSVASSRAGQAMRLDSYDYPKNEEQGDTQ